jgi:Putative zincin peptidase
MSEITNNKSEFTLSTGKVNLYSLIIIFPVTAIYLIPYILVWDFASFEIGRKEFMNLFIYILIFGIIIHELLHGITWAFFTKKGFKSIKFGINGITPYCHCKESLMAKHYRLGGAMPLIIMGIIPSLIGIALGNGLYLSFGIFFSWAACGDIISLFMLRKINSNTLVSDHPDRMGFYLSE